MVPVMVLFLLFVQSFHYIAVQIVYLKITLLYVPNYIRVIVSLGMTNLTFYCTGTGTDGLQAGSNRVGLFRLASIRVCFLCLHMSSYEATAINAGN